jgi:hypothetical protein
VYTQSGPGRAQRAGNPLTALGPLNGPQIAWPGKDSDPHRVRGSLRFGTFGRTTHNSGGCTKRWGLGEMVQRRRARVGIAAKSGLADTSGLCPC